MRRYIKTVSNIILEICGDGRNMGILECDDGNLLDGDGCSSICNVEPNYVCTGGDFSHCDICHSTLPLLFQDVLYYGNKTVFLIFSKPVFFKSTSIHNKLGPKLEKMFSLKIEGNYGQNFSYTWTYEQINEEMVALYMDYQSSLSGDEVFFIKKYF